MRLYQLKVQIKGSNHHFELELEGDDAFSEDGDWTATAPADLYLGERDGFWRLHRVGDGYAVFHLYDKDWASAWKVWTWGDDYPAELADLRVQKMGVILDQRHKGHGSTTIRRGSWDFTWEVTQRFF